MPFWPEIEGRFCGIFYDFDSCSYQISEINHIFLIFFLKKVSSFVKNFYICVWYVTKNARLERLIVAKNEKSAEVSVL